MKQVTFSMALKQREAVSREMARMIEARPWKTMSLSYIMRTLVDDGLKYREEQRAKAVEGHDNG